MKENNSKRRKGIAGAVAGRCQRSRSRDTLAVVDRDQGEEAAGIGSMIFSWLWERYFSRHWAGPEAAGQWSSEVGEGTILLTVIE
jgi:hypothetical protein